MWENYWKTFQGLQDIYKTFNGDEGVQVSGSNDGQAHVEAVTLELEPIALASVSTCRYGEEMAIPHRKTRRSWDQYPPKEEQACLDLDPHKGIQNRSGGDKGEAHQQLDDPYSTNPLARWGNNIDEQVHTFFFIWWFPSGVTTANSISI